MKKVLRLLDHDLASPSLGLAFIGATLVAFMLADSCESAARRHHEREVLRLQLEASARAPAPPAPSGAP